MFICLFRSVMVSPVFFFSGTVFLLVDPKAFYALIHHSDVASDIRYLNTAGLVLPIVIAAFPSCPLCCGWISWDSSCSSTVLSA